MNAIPILPVIFFLGAVHSHGQEVGSLPEVNRSIQEFVEANMRKKVGSGECWDLAAQALDHAQADWDGSYGFGRVIDPLKEPVLPGDIIQFKNVVTRDKSGNMLREERMPHHTAIVHKVLDEGIYDIAHQNTDITGRKVGVTRFILENIVRGKATFHRPVVRGE